MPVPAEAPADVVEPVETVKVELMLLADDVLPPAYARPGDAGADLCSTEDLLLAPGERRLVGTGVALALPEGYAGFVHPRSGLAARVGLSIVNAPGTVDAGYRGEIKVCLVNTDRVHPIRLRRGDRIAQLVVQRVVRVQFVAVDRLPQTVRGTAGHGSTGGFTDHTPDHTPDHTDGVTSATGTPSAHAPAAPAVPAERPA